MVTVAEARVPRGIDEVTPQWLSEVLRADRVARKSVGRQRHSRGTDRPGHRILVVVVPAAPDRRARRAVDGDRQTARPIRGSVGDGHAGWLPAGVGVLPIRRRHGSDRNTARLRRRDGRGLCGFRPGARGSAGLGQR